MLRFLQAWLFALLFIYATPRVAGAAGTNGVEHLGPEFPERPTADAIVQQFMRKYEVPGLSLAISRNDQMVYAGAFGWADEKRSQPLTLTNRLRMASCSKPITALAVLRLVEQGRINLDAPVFGKDGLLGTGYGVPTFERKPAVITVRHLLQHAAGGWGNKSADPIFDYHDLGLDDIIRRTVAERELKSAPGTAYAYSNFGFALLGKIIEKVTGATYEAAVRDLVLRPCEAAGMRISAMRGARPEPDEPHYFGAPGERPYRLRPEIMQAHGGWIATPMELLQVLDRVDGNAAVPDILQAESLQLLMREGVPRSNYSLGWSVNRARNKWHLGSMPGTFAMICCASNGFNWALLMNTRPTQSKFSTDADQLVWKILESVRDWPRKAAE